MAASGRLRKSKRSKVNWQPLTLSSQSRRSPKLVRVTHLKESQRSITGEEKEFLQQILDAHPAKYRKLKMAVGNAAISWCFFMLLVVIGWLIVAWITRKLLGAEIGWNNNIAAVWVVSVGGIFCLVFAIVSTARWIRGWTDIREPLLADIANQRVNVEEYEFREVLRMQEPEHLGLIYFMREDDEAAFVYFDSESQDLGVQGEDPLSSSFIPRRHLRVTRAPVSGVAIVCEFTGDALQLGDPIEISVPPDQWPEHEEVCKVPWSELKSTFAG